MEWLHWVVPFVLGAVTTAAVVNWLWWIAKIIVAYAISVSDLASENKPEILYRYNLSKSVQGTFEGKLRSHCSGRFME